MTKTAYRKTVEKNTNIYPALLAKLHTLNLKSDGDGLEKKIEIVK